MNCDLSQNYFCHSRQHIVSDPQLSRVNSGLQRSTIKSVGNLSALYCGVISFSGKIKIFNDEKKLKKMIFFGSFS
jgi:hypothetical protein